AHVDGLEQLPAQVLRGACPHIQNTETNRVLEDANWVEFHWVGTSRSGVLGLCHCRQSRLVLHGDWPDAGGRHSPPYVYATANRAQDILALADPLADGCTARQ